MSYITSFTHLRVGSPRVLGPVVVALGLAGVGCGPPRTRTPSPPVPARATGDEARRPEPRPEPNPGPSPAVVAATTPPDGDGSGPESASEEPPESSPEAAESTTPSRDSEGRAAAADPPDEAPQAEDADQADEEAPAIEATTSAPSVVPAGPPVSIVQQVPSRLEEPLHRSQRHGRPEIENIPDPSWVDPTVLVLARICVSEAGWEGQRDCQGIFQVLRNVRRNNETFLGVMRRASRVVSEMWEPTTDRHRWLVNLDLEGTRPDGFPTEADWERHYRHRWMKVLEYARALLEGEIYAHPCQGAVIAWGGKMDDYLALRRNLIRAECGDTQNTFWKRPPSGG